MNDPENTEKRRSRESLSVDVVKYESGPDGGEEVSMSVEWNGVCWEGLREEQKRMTEDEMAGWHHRPDGRGCPWRLWPHCGQNAPAGRGREEEEGVRKEGT